MYIECIHVVFRIMLVVFKCLLAMQCVLQAFCGQVNIYIYRAEGIDSRGSINFGNRVYTIIIG